MIGLSPQCYIPSFMTIGLPVWEKKIFEGFLPYMGMAANLVMWPGPCEQTFVPRQTTDYRQQTMTTEASHTISSPVSQRLSWANKQGRRTDTNVDKNFYFCDLDLWSAVITTDQHPSSCNRLVLCCIYYKIRTGLVNAVVKDQCKFTWYILHCQEIRRNENCQ